MPTCETTIRIDRPSRYLVQFCQHAAAMGKTGGGHRPHGATRDALARRELEVHAEYTDTRGVVTISPWGWCTLRATTDTLTLRVDATDQDAVRRIQDIVTRDLERFGRRDHVTVTWPPPHATDPATTNTGATPLPLSKTAIRPKRQNAILLAVLIVVAIAIHLGPGAGIVANARWASLSVDVLLALVVVKSLLVTFGSRALRGHTRPGGARLHARRPARHHNGLAATQAGDPAHGNQPPTDTHDTGPMAHDKPPREEALPPRADADP